MLYALGMVSTEIYKLLPLKTSLSPLHPMEDPGEEGSVEPPRL